MSIIGEAELEGIYKHVYELVIKGGQVLREGYYGRKEIQKKSAFYDMVTEYDKRIEDLLINGIQEKYPNHKFIGEEESSKKTTESELTDDPTWIIDPIDGTTNFIQRIPHVCISIGLAVKKELLIGIVFNPISNELFTAQKGKGAMMNGQKISVSDCQKLNDAVIGFEISLIHSKITRDKLLKCLYKLGTNARGTRTFGSAALAICYVANGSLDCYHVEYLKPWDIAAGAIILREAGGIICHPTGTEFNVMVPDLVCTSSEKLTKEVLKYIEDANKMTHVHFD